MVSKREGKRERAARKRRRRGLFWSTSMPSTVGWLKLGHKHFLRMIHMDGHLEVADSEKGGGESRSPTGNKTASLLSFYERHQNWIGAPYLKGKDIGQGN